MSQAEYDTWLACLVIAEQQEHEQDDDQDDDDWHGGDIPHVLES